ncbi:carbon-nitrogen hydrolase family protein [Streptomyces sp. SL13]|uniref:Carbon-nitrogen hydrolase family protein n=1 Tax=Streptantibioticus silvisoli TaxID=2705255 RepID=A0AA90KEW5_9ACTN|nr:carbon-nitrogen hydrolase family protein [Streptantibioticus silvisoli]MDI5968294.1 carbon-nitrogen hydrolase family protein [Streptantibioticus silvisoli]
MTANRNLKRRVRARAAKTGESYTTALRHVRPNPSGDVMPGAKRVRLAVAQTAVGQDPRDQDALRAAGREVRRLMREAARAGARVAQFTEGATCFPGKRVMSAAGPQVVGPADWDRFAWDVLRGELTAIADLARELRLWTVLGSTHRLTPPHRPHNSMYVISDRGTVVTRYDERMLSNTKISFMYAPGVAPVTFAVDGVRFGCALGMECHFPEIFAEYESLDVDCVLFSTTGGAPGDDEAFALETQAHAAVNGFWAGFAVPARPGADAATAGIVTPAGTWAARCPSGGAAAFVVADVGHDPQDPATAFARPWRRTARSGLYERYAVGADARSEDRAGF